MTPRLRLAATLCVASTLCYCADQPATIDGITFYDNPRLIFAPAREVVKLFGWNLKYDPAKRAMNIRGHAIPPAATRMLPDGTLLVSLAELRPAGAIVNWDPVRQSAAVKDHGKTLFVRVGQKRVVVNRWAQQLRAFQGRRMVMKSQVSTGQEGFTTPIGTWHIKPLREKMHRSSLYHNAPMPWSVQVAKDIFIHGAATANGEPSSHGCIRLPVTGHNPARWFYYWAEVGTPVTITGSWPKRLRAG